MPHSSRLRLTIPTTESHDRRAAGFRLPLVTKPHDNPVRLVSRSLSDFPLSDTEDERYAIAAGWVSDGIGMGARLRG